MIRIAVSSGRRACASIMLREGDPFDPLGDQIAEVAVPTKIQDA